MLVYRTVKPTLKKNLTNPKLPLPFRFGAGASPNGWTPRVYKYHLLLGMMFHAKNICHFWFAMIFVEEKSLAILIFLAFFAKQNIQNTSYVTPRWVLQNFTNSIQEPLSELPTLKWTNLYPPSSILPSGQKKTHNPWKNGRWLVLNPHLIAHLLVI